MKEYITLEEVIEAYLECKKHKSNKISTLLYNLNYEYNNYKLYEELNNMTYSSSISIVFCVSKPKLREVFAANFRDRIVHHILIRKLNPFIESKLINNTFACRKGKGTLYGIKKILEIVIKNPNAWYVKCDIKGFFMSINKNILISLVNKIIQNNIKENKDWWKWLAKVIIFSRPELNCKKYGNIKLFDNLPPNKTLFKTNGVGLPIGNLPSQILANLYMSDFDNYFSKKLNGNYGRYLDDFIFIGNNKKLLLELLKEARIFLKENLNLILHPNKIVILPVRNGIRFIGYFIKHNIILCGKRVRYNASNIIRKWNLKLDHSEDERLQFIRSYNSYCGLLKHSKSYHIRRRMWRNILDYNKLININMNKINEPRRKISFRNFLE